LRKAVTKIRKSGLLKEAYYKQCELVGMKRKELTHDVATRWNSTYFMLKRAFKMQMVSPRNASVSVLTIPNVKSVFIFIAS
jgi:hypothetical protein